MEKVNIKILEATKPISLFNLFGNRKKIEEALPHIKSCLKTLDISIFSSDLVVYLEDAKELIDIFTKLDNAPINKVLVRIPKPNSSSFEFILEKFHKLKNSEYIMKKLKKCCESIKLEDTCVIPSPTTK